MGLIDLKFDFSNPDNITFYGDKVSGFRNNSGTVKAFLQNEEEFVQWDSEANQLVVPTAKATSFNFKPKINLENDFEIKIDLEIGDDFMSTYLFGSEAIYFNLLSDGIHVFLEKIQFMLPFNQKLTKGQHVIYLSRQGGVMWVEQEGDYSSDVSQAIYEEPILLDYFLGGMTNGEVKYNSFSLTDDVEEKVSTTLEEVNSNEIDIPEVGVVEIDEGNIETEDPIEEMAEEIANQTNLGEEIKQEIFNIKDMRKLTELEKQMISGYEGILKAAKGTKIAKYYKTADEIEQEALSSKTFLVKVFYYILVEQPLFSDSKHAEIKTRAYELFEMFGKGDENEEGRRYGFADGVVYKSFMYGEITDEDLTDDLIVELLIEEYEGVRALIIKR